MKSLQILLLMLIPFWAEAQNLSQNLWTLIPKVPQNICEAEYTEKEEFLDSITNAKDYLKQQRDNIMQVNESHEDEYRNQAMNTMQQKYGLSQAEMDKVKSGKKLTDAEKQAMMNKALQNSTNISMDEVKNLQNMSEEGKKAWAEAYGYEKMAESQIDTVATQKKQEENMSMYQLMQRQQFLQDSLTKAETKMSGKFEDIKNSPKAQTMLNNIRDWKRQLESGDVSGDDYQELLDKIENEEANYCDEFSKQYTDLLKVYKNHIVNSIPKYYELQDISERLTKLQSGVTMHVEKGIIDLDRISEYLHYLQDAYQYNLNL